jgi:manganese transport protein
MADPMAEPPALPLDTGEQPGSLSESFRSVRVPARGSRLRRALAFIGPGYLVAVGYMDPGNWATDLAAGSSFGYDLLWVILLSNLMAMLLQVLSARLGIATGQDLAQACRDRYSRRSAFMQWLLCEAAIIACDLAEVIGTAIALQLLFGIPLPWGVALTTLDALLVLWLQQRGFRYLEAFVMALIATVFVCIGGTLLLSQPDWSAVATGFVPSASTITERDRLLIAIGLLGATVMPHNLYLHSSVVQTRRFALDPEGRRQAIRYSTIDVIVALSFAFVINAAILVTAASVFHVAGRSDVAEIQDAYYLLAPLLGTGLASTLFGVALLASGNSSTLTATLAGQIVMEGYVRLRMKPWKRRLLTRGLAVIPAMIVAMLWGESGTARLLIASQLALSLQLPFAVVPLVRLTSDRARMGEFASSPLLRLGAWMAATVIIGLNLTLLLRTVV